MKRILWGLLHLGAGLLAALTIVVLAGVLYSDWFKSTPPFLDAQGNVLAGSVATFEDVELGGYKQAVLIRGRSADNPVLLYLHGGPGSTELPLVRHFNSVLEDHFTVALWDQRGAGKSYSPFLDKKTMTIDQFLSDAHELMQYLMKRLHKERIFLVGHSWGSFLGLELARRYPQELYAYVGIGQEISVPDAERLSMKFTLEQAEAAHNAQALAELRSVGEYPSLKEDWLRDVFTQRRWLGEFGGVMYGKHAMGSLFSIQRPPEFSLFDFVPFALGSYSSLKALWPQVLKAGDLRATAAKLEVPAFFVIGKHDYNAPFALAREYFDKLEAPKKEWVWFESSAHMPNFEEPAKFNAFMIEKVLPEAGRGTR